MTRRSLGVRFPHSATEQAYGEELGDSLAQFALLAKKWQDEDIIWPHSDLDLRVVLWEAPPDWLRFNEALAEAHRSQVGRDPLMRRVLEHPPGFVFLARELDQQLVRPAEISTWSISHGPTLRLECWRDLHANLPWTVDDEEFYWSLLSARTAGRYSLASDSTDNVTRHRSEYLYHCVMWHYFAPCHVATHALATRIRATGKASTMSLTGHGLARDVLAAAKSGYRGAVTAAALLGLAGHEFALPERCTPDAALHIAAPVAQDAVGNSLADRLPMPAGHGAAERKRRLVGSLATLRCRPARFLYYLKPSPGAVTAYLLGRESKDLGAALTDLRDGLDLLPRKLREAALTVLEQFPLTTDGRNVKACLSELYRRPDAYERLMSAAPSEIGDIEP